MLNSARGEGDNSNNKLSNGELKYIRTVGTSYSKAIQHSFDLSVSIAREIGASFFEIFSAALGVR